MKAIVCSCLLALPAICSGQADTVVHIILKTKVKTTVASVGDQRKVSTPSSSAGIVLNNLPGAVPSANLFEGSYFTMPMLAEKTLDVKGYPASTTVQLLMLRDDQSVGQCTGNMVAPNLVLTAAHCLIDQSLREEDYDAIIVAAAGENRVNGGVLVSRARSAYVLKRHLDNKSQADIMLLELEDPIGDQTGWVGITSDTGNINHSLFHKFSFPAKALDISITNSHGRQLHYNYGKIGFVDQDIVGIPNAVNANATPGQSGSSFLLMRHDSCYSIGVAVYSRKYQHQQITKSIFHAFQPIIEESAQNANTMMYTLYPTPIRASAVLKVSVRMNRFTFVLLNSKGEVVRTQRGNDSNMIFIDRGGLVTGEYGFRLMDDSGRKAKGSFRIE
jgi:V8-like Glu-specific endopeptidase